MGGEDNISHLGSLFQPAKVGNVELKNRIVMLAMGTHFVIDDMPTPRWRDFYAERAKGGAGLVIVPLNPLPTAPSQREQMPGIYDDKARAGLCELVDIVHGYGAKICAHFVNDIKFPTPDGRIEYVGPSYSPPSRHGPETRALSVEEIKVLVERYGEGTRRAREAGFDLVEYHFGMGQLINRFISSATNKRGDEYGGSLEKRLRLPLEIIASAQKKAGRDLPLMCRLSADELTPGGHTLKETEFVASQLVTAGLKALSVQAGSHQSPVPIVDMSVPRGAFVYLAEAVKKMVDVPVIATYRINDPILADRIVAEGRADLVGMARALLADPEFPNKAREGRIDDICPCIACCLCIDKAVAERSAIKCAVNPRVGHEGEHTIGKVKRAKKVFVIGGGPGGMEAAIVASQRGHHVTLFDKGDRLGGQLLAAAVPPHKQEISGLVDYMAGQANKTGIKIKLGKEVALEDIIAGKPDVVIVATGANPLIPDIPGIGKPHVVTAIDVLNGLKPVGQSAIIIGGGLVGCETALHLAMKGTRVTLLEMLPHMGVGIGPSTKWIMLRNLAESGVVMRTKSKVVSITDKGVGITCNGTSDFIEGHTVVLAVGMSSEKNLLEKLSGKVAELYAIGDCARPRRLGDAIEEGFNAGQRI